MSDAKGRPRGVVAEVEGKLCELYTSAVAAKSCGLRAERLHELADAGLVPHYRIDTEPLFRISELKAWLGRNLVRCDGADLPQVVRVTEAVDVRAVPAGLIDVAPHLKRVTAESGIYFLIRDAKVVYVGQSVCVGARVAAHKADKNFEYALFLPWPANDLTRIEMQFIKALAPEYNRAGLS